jgi:hypothetical protein
VALLVVIGVPARAFHWDLELRLCPEEIRELPPIIERIPYVPGCEIIDCCPGCPGPGPFDWRIQVEGEAFDGAVVRFEGLAPGEIGALGIEGGAVEKDGSVLVGKREATIRGVPGVEARPGIAARITPRIAGAYPSRSGDPPASAAKDPDADAAGRIVIEQLLGGFQVNFFEFRPRWRLCPERGLALVDEVELSSNDAGDQAVVLSDHRSASGCRNDQVHRGATETQLENALPGGVCNSEVAVFSDDDAMALHTPVTTWTNNAGDVHPVTLDPMIDVPLRIWLARANAVALATNDVANANLLYNQNNTGIRFVADIRDVSANQAAVTAIGEDCDDAGTAQGSAWYAANMLNVYYTSGVFTGVNCGLDRNINYVGTTANLGTLPHEIGHAYGLRPAGSGGHTNNLPGFGNDNIMWGGGPATRNHFSVGQAFRLNVDTGSMLNANGNRTGPTRACAPDTTSNQCPALSLDALPH